MADISSGWSTWKWDSSRGVWYASRKRSDGSYEFDYQENNAAGDYSQTPRTPDPNIYPATQNTQGPSTGQYQNSYPTYPDNDLDATSRRSISSMSASTNAYYNPTVASSSRGFNVAQNWAQTTTTGMTGYTNSSTYSQPTVHSTEYTYAPSTAVPSSADGVANSFGQMSLRPPPAQATQGAL
jgi:hypothetical protein